MFTVDLPYDIGTFVKVPRSFDGKGIICGTIVGYSVFNPPDMTVIVSGYEESFCGEYLLKHIELMSDEEIQELEARYS